MKTIFVFHKVAFRGVAFKLEQKDWHLWEKVNTGKIEEIIVITTEISHFTEAG